jgi:hypothetical protein
LKLKDQWNGYTYFKLKVKGQNLVFHYCPNEMHGVKKVLLKAVLLGDSGYVNFIDNFRFHSLLMFFLFSFENLMKILLIVTWLNYHYDFLIGVRRLCLNFIWRGKSIFLKTCPLCFEFVWIRCRLLLFTFGFKKFFVICLNF